MNERSPFSLLSTLAIKCAICCAALAFSASGIAGPINPIPSDYANDSGDELFMPTGLSFSVELFDVLGDPSFPDLSGAEFGFYYASDPSSLITIFDSTDHASGGDLPNALVDFNSGVVLDNDEAALQSIFTPKSDPIGFYLSIGVLPDPIFSQSTLNLSGLDLVSTFPSLTIPNAFLIGFELQDPSNGDSFTLAYEFITEIVPVKVPAPGFVLLLILATAGIAIRRRR